MALTYQEWPDARLVEITVDGRVTQDDLDAVLPKMEALIEARGGGLRMVEVVHSFGGFEPSALWEGLTFDFRHIREFERCAVVTDLGWIGPASRVASAVVPVRLRVFPLDDLEAARDWARSEAP